MEKLLATHEKENFTPPEAVTDINPVLVGQFPENDPPHSILHYVDRNNPLGPAPQNPQKDPLYAFWEKAIQNWLGVQLPPPIDPNAPPSTPEAPENPEPSPTLP